MGEFRNRFFETDNIPENLIFNYGSSCRPDPETGFSRAGFEILSLRFRFFFRGGAVAGGRGGGRRMSFRRRCPPRSIKDFRKTGPHSTGSDAHMSAVDTTVSSRRFGRAYRVGHSDSKRPSVPPNYPQTPPLQPLKPEIMAMDL